MLKPPFPIAELYRGNNKKRLRMKVITIESTAYQGMMEQIAEIAGHVRELRKERERRQEAETKDRLLDSAQAAGLLSVSLRTLQRRREDHRIEYIMVRGSCRYRLSEVRRLLEDGTVKGKEETIDDLFRNFAVRTGGNKQTKGRRT